MSRRFECQIQCATDYSDLAHRQVAAAHACLGGMDVHECLQLLPSE